MNGIDFGIISHNGSRVLENDPFVTVYYNAYLLVDIGEAKAGDAVDKMIIDHNNCTIKAWRCGKLVVDCTIGYTFNGETL
jgi:hypothetical protein